MPSYYLINDLQNFYALLVNLLLLQIKRTHGLNLNNYINMFVFCQRILVRDLFMKKAQP